MKHAVGSRQVPDGVTRPAAESQAEGIKQSYKRPPSPRFEGTPRDTGGTQAIVRAADIIGLVASFSIDGLRLVDIAASLKLSRPTVHRIVNSLVALGWLRRAPGEHRYFLGHALFELGLTAAPQFKLGEMCQPSLDRLGRRAGEVAFLTIRSGRDAISIAKSKGKAFAHKAAQIGTHRPLGIGSGSLALLMTLREEEADEIVLTNATRLRAFADVNTQILLESVRLSRDRGFVFQDERLLKGVSGVAIPVKDNEGITVAAMSISVIAPRLEQARAYEFLAFLRKEVKHVQQLLSTDVGYAVERMRLVSKSAQL